MQPLLLKNFVLFHFTESSLIDTTGAIIGSVVFIILLLVIIIIIIIIIARYQFLITILLLSHYRRKRSHSNAGKYRVNMSLSQLQSRFHVCDYND